MNITEAILKESKHSIVIVGLSPWYNKINEFLFMLNDCLKNNQNLKVTIFAESEQGIFLNSLLLDNINAINRTSFDQLILSQNYLINKLLELDSDDRLELKIIYSKVGQYLVLGDDNTMGYIPSTHMIPSPDDFTFIDYGSPLFSNLLKYLDYIQEEAGGGKWTAKPADEIIELYDFNLTPRGVFPRKAFNNSDYYKLVIWNFILDRAGNLLVHKRSENAKDNRGMWDKSVGGHVDWKRELRTPDSAVRETIEELYEDELNKETMAHFTESERNFIYLGDWLPNKRHDYPFNEISKFTNEWVFFSLPKPVICSSPRHLIDGSIQNVNVIASVYLFIANERMTSSKINNFENSDFRSVSITELKNDIESGEFVDSNGKVIKFNPSPDINYVMTSKLRGTLENFSQYIRIIFSNS